MMSKAALAKMKARLHELDDEIAALQDAERDAMHQIRERAALWMAAHALECSLCGCGG